MTIPPVYRPLPECPSSPEDALSFLAHPSTSIVLLCSSIVALVYGIISTCLLLQIVVPLTRDGQPRIIRRWKERRSILYFIATFLLVFLRNTLLTIRYGMGNSGSLLFHELMHVGTTLTLGLSALTLSLGLSYQIHDSGELTCESIEVFETTKQAKSPSSPLSVGELNGPKIPHSHSWISYRSARVDALLQTQRSDHIPSSPPIMEESPPLHHSSELATEKSPTLSSSIVRRGFSSSMKSMRSGSALLTGDDILWCSGRCRTILPFVLCVIVLGYEAVGLTRIFVGDETGLWLAWVVMTLFLRFPQLFLAIVVCYGETRGLIVRAPRMMSRLFLMLSVIVSMLDDISFEDWAVILNLKPSDCIWNAFSVIDIIVFVYFVSLSLLFAYLVLEYRRDTEFISVECLRNPCVFGVHTHPIDELLLLTLFCSLPVSCFSFECLCGAVGSGMSMSSSPGSTSRSPNGESLQDGYSFSSKHVVEEMEVIEGMEREIRLLRRKLSRAEKSLKDELARKDSTVQSLIDENDSLRSEIRFLRGEVERLSSKSTGEEESPERKRRAIPTSCLSSMTEQTGSPSVAVEDECARSPNPSSSVSVPESNVSSPLPGGGYASIEMTERTEGVASEDEVDSCDEEREDVDLDLTPAIFSILRKELGDEIGISRGAISCIDSLLRSVLHGVVDHSFRSSSETRLDEDSLTVERPLDDESIRTALASMFPASILSELDARVRRELECSSSGNSPVDDLETSDAESSSDGSHSSDSHSF